jgi:hypothetical protein
MNVEDAKHRGLRIRTLNCRKSPEVLKSLLNDNDTPAYDILLIQEPPYFVADHLSFSLSAYHLILPSPASTQRRTDLIRSVIYIHRCIPSDSYNQLHIPSLDLTALTLTIHDSVLSIFSIYNPPSLHSSITALANTLATQITGRPVSDTHLFIAGDFNKHHPLWSGQCVPKRYRLTDAKPLINLLARFNLHLCLPPGTAMCMGAQGQRWTTLDLVFASEYLSDLFVSCTMSPGHGSDHFLVNSQIDIDLPCLQPPPRLNWRAVDWEKYQKALNSRVAAAGLEERCANLTNTASLDSTASSLLQCMRDAAAKTVPFLKPCPLQKRWWSKDLSRQREEYNCIVRKANKPSSTPADCAAVKPSCNAYQKAIRQQQRSHWKEWVEGATEETIWKTSK